MVQIKTDKNVLEEKLSINRLQLDLDNDTERKLLNLMKHYNVRTKTKMIQALIHSAVEMIKHN